VLDRTFDLYRANFRTILMASAYVVFPLALAAGVAQVFYTRGALSLVQDLFSNSAFEPELAAFAELQMWGWVANAVTLPYWVARVYIASCLYDAAGGMLYGERRTVKEFMRGGLRRFWPLLGASAVLAVVSFFYVLIFPVVLLAGWVFAPLATVAESAPFDRAFKRSWSLTLGGKRRVAVFYIVVMVFVLVIEAAVSSPALVRQIVAGFQSPDAIFKTIPVGWRAVEGLFAAFAATVVVPFTQLAWYSLYLDFRARREGLDLVVPANEARR